MKKSRQFSPGSSHCNTFISFFLLWTVDIMDPLEEKITEEVKTTTRGLVVFPSNRGSNYNVSYKGYLYNYHMTGKNNRNFRCSKYTKSAGGCTARIHLHWNYSSLLFEEQANEVTHKQVTSNIFRETKTYFNPIMRTLNFL